MNRNYAKPGIILFLGTVLLVFSVTFTFTRAQDSAERTEEASQPQEESQIEPTQPAEQPPTEIPRVVEPTMEQ